MIVDHRQNVRSALLRINGIYERSKTVAKRIEVRFSVPYTKVGDLGYDTHEYENAEFSTLDNGDLVVHRQHQGFDEVLGLVLAHYSKDQWLYARVLEG